MSGTPTDDPELAELLTMLRTVDAEAPAARLDVDALLARARHAERRRRAGWWTAGVAAAAAASVVVAVPSLVHLGGPTGAAVPAATSVQVSPLTASPSSASHGDTATSLDDVYGPDWSRSGVVPGGFGGDLVLLEGSTSAQGLPDGYRAAVRAMTLPLEYSSVTGLCEPLVEKGMTSSGCRDVTLTDGTLAHRVDIDAPNTAPGTWATLRLIYQRPDGVVQLIDVVISHVNGSTTAAQRQQARAWLERQLATSEKAATQVRLPAGPTKS